MVLLLSRLPPRWSVMRLTNGMSQTRVCIIELWGVLHRDRCWYQACEEYSAAWPSLRWDAGLAS